MSIKSKIITAAAALSLIVGVGAAGTQTANAATVPCGLGCANLFSFAFGIAGNPVAYVLDVPGGAQVGGAVILAQESHTNPNEDFTESVQGTVHDLFLAGLVPSGLDALYSSRNVFEMEFAPGGVESGLCVGVAVFSVSLQPCGTGVKTLWILDPQTTVSFIPYFAVISAATTNFQHPDSLTTLFFPGMQLVTAPLLPYNRFPALSAHQLWGVVRGVLP
jgi:hypothetical protein